MYFFVSPYYDAALNLAIEEILLKQSVDEFVFIYRNSESVIVGKHQNSMAEVNYNYIIENEIPVIRRISGGGAVYHDLGNINFSFILNVPGYNKVDFRKYTQPVYSFLQSKSLPVSFGDRNELLLNGKKISGNAEHVYKNRVLHHGTLLFETDLTRLQNSLKVNLLSYSDKSMKSVRSLVCNIHDYLQNTVIDDFINEMGVFLMELLDAQVYKLPESILSEATKLINAKYNTWEWNFGYNPKYTFENSTVFNNNSFTVRLKVEKGIIEEADIISESSDEGLSLMLKTDFKKVRHDFDSIKKHLKTLVFFRGKDDGFVNSYVKLFF